MIMIFLHHQAAVSIIDALLAASQKTTTAGAQLRDAVVEIGRSDDHDTINNVPRVRQMFVDVEAQQRVIYQQAAAASEPAGFTCALDLRSDEDEILGQLKEMGGFDTRRTLFVDPGRLIERLDSRVLEHAHSSFLLSSFGDRDIPVGHSTSTALQ